MFPRVDFQNFLARDKELSTFTSQAIRAGVAYDFGREGMGPLDRGRVSFFWDYLFIDYENFNDLRVTDVLPGDEPQFSLDANVIQLFISFWY